MKDTTQLYIYPASYAHEHGELEQYRASYKANIACKEAIEQAIADHYRDNCLSTEAVHQVVEQFGYDRNVYFVVDRSHPGLTDLFLTQARREYALAQEKKPSVRDSLNKNAGQQVRAEKPKQHKGQER